ncbi:unnamed protein product [Hermetia illucens]|uniref:Little elongation complex subunit 2 C-terminal domain-containing protein n=1 Tax=Hermetia illucens TaxID=343691 RepID=A0A7R8YZJ1_HERIL|nr:unnamed protein product [Hermetia illucens]
MEEPCELSWSWYKIRQSREYLKYFDDTFSAKNSDIFFCHLNEIEAPLTSKNETQLSIDYEAVSIDPRSKKVIVNPIVDNSELVSKTRMSKMFAVFTKVSALTEKEHKSGLQVLLHDQEKMKTSSQVLTSNKRVQEMKEFNAIVEKMLCVEPIRTSRLKEVLIAQYLQILQNKAQKIINKGNQFYSIQSAIPFGSKNENAIQYTQGEIVKQSGDVIEYLPNFNFTNVLKSEKKRLFAETAIILPEASAILLLNCCPTLESWEIAFKITPSDCNSNGLISFDEPLPLRSGTEFVCHQTLEYIIRQQMLSKADCRCLSLDDGKIRKNTYGEHMDIHAVDLDCDYHIVDYNEYLHKKTPRPSESIAFSSSEIFRKWAIKRKSSNANSMQMNIITKTSVPFFQFENGEPTFVNLSLKIENKIDFGAELMTKNELTREWLRQYLISNGFTKRVRLDAHDSKLIAIQNLDLNDIEAELKRLYNTSPEDMLSPLFSMLTLIQNFPVGDYLLKFNPKFSDKLMVYSKASTNSVNGINLPELYESIRFKGNFIQSSDYIPIDGNVVTDWHKTYNVLPCCFPHWHISEKSLHKELDKAATQSKRTRKKAKMNKSEVKNDYIYGNNDLRKMPNLNSIIRDHWTLKFASSKHVNITLLNTMIINNLILLNTAIILRKQKYYIVKS